MSVPTHRETLRVPWPSSPLATPASEPRARRPQLECDSYRQSTLRCSNRARINTMTLGESRKDSEKRPA
eukprot:236005-Rhodomonas_salina.2